MARWVMLGWLMAAGCWAGAGAQLRLEAGLSPGRETASLAALNNVQAVLRDFSAQAGVIFAGEVVAIRQGQSDGTGFAGGVVEVDFRVDEAVRGCTPGLYTLREWGGLWGAAGEQRYKVGQRALVFLRAPGASGLSSPVAGQDGVVPMVGAGVAPGPLDTTTDAGATMLDLRWVQTHVAQRLPAMRPVHPIAREGILAEANGLAAVDDAVSAVPAPASVSTAAVLRVLRGWEEERRAAR